MKKVSIIFVLLLILFGGFFMYQKNSSRSRLSGTSNNNLIKKLQVSTSFYPLYFFASEIGGDKTEVKNITPSGSEPHDYDPTTQDVARIEKSDMLVLNGGVESWGDKIKDNVKGTQVKIIVAGEGLLTQQLEEGGKNQTDPHVWLDPELAKKEVRAITQGYISIDFVNAMYYEKNEKDLDNKLDQLDASYKQGLQNCKQKDIITSHAAFGYLANRYGIKQVPITGLSPDAEPSSKQLGDVATFAKEHNVQYIFFESLVSPKLSETIANEIGAKTLVLDPLEGISDDDMKAGKNYFTVMQDNLNNLKIALECKT